MARETIEHWVAELRDLWHAWSRETPLAPISQEVDFDSLALITYHMLLPVPEPHEVRHGVHYLFNELMDLGVIGTDHPEVLRLAEQLLLWRETKPRHWG